MIDTKNALLITVVLFVAAVVGLYIPYQQYQKSQNASSSLIATNTTEGARVTITYTNKGFEPSTISVATGTTVEWINLSDKLMWIASDPHPSHTNLPGFDQRGTESNEDTQSAVPIAYAHGGGGYMHTFTTAGTWTYHNHLDPAGRGVVVVEP